MADFTARKNILVAGGAGYIGTHTAVVLLQAGYDITVVDNLVNSSPEGIERAIKIVGCEASRVKFHHVDICNEGELDMVFRSSTKFEACIHFAGLKAVGESVAKPLLYYENNLISTFALLKLMDKYDCHRIVFSSSATVYGAASVPITESTPAGAGITNAYGRTKYMIEEILKDFIRSKEMEAAAAAAEGSGSPETPPWSIVVLRYFNPVGNHESGLIGEDPNGIPNNLMPYVSQVVTGRREKLTIFGDDYPTKDGTGVRDYIHVMDLAEGHVKALDYMKEGKKGHGKYAVFNLGTGIGYSVLDMVSAMKKASGKDLPIAIGPRRGGDIAVCYADPAQAAQELGWTAGRNLDDVCNDLWKWASTNPNGYSVDESDRKINKALSMSLGKAWG